MSSEFGPCSARRSSAAQPSYDAACAMNASAESATGDFEYPGRRAKRERPAELRHEEVGRRERPYVRWAASWSGTFAARPGAEAIKAAGSLRFSLRA